MNRIITLDKLRARLALMNDVGVNGAIDSSLDAAIAHTSSLLGTDIDSGAKDDVFFIDPDTQVAINGMYTLRLTHGFVRADPGIEVYTGGTIAEVNASTDSIDGYLLNAEKGFVGVGEDLAGTYVRVSYEYGFTEDEEVPLWLQEVVLGQTVKVLTSQQIADGKPELANVLAALQKSSYEIMDRHLRSNSEAIWPLM